MKNATESTSSESSDGFSVKSSIPVMRMLDEARARTFYLDYLGFEIDWEHRFGDDETSPLHMQIHLGNAVVHLNGHADDDSPVCEVRFPVHGLDQCCEHLCVKDGGFKKPEMVDPRYEGCLTDMNLLDPSGNHLVFWSPKSMQR